MSILNPSEAIVNHPIDNKNDAGPRLTLVPNSISQAFVELLTGSKDGVIRLRFIHDCDRAKPSVEREGTLAQLWPELVEFQQQGYGAFYFINGIKPGDGSGKGGCATDDDVTAIRALATDHDDGLPEDWEWHDPPRIVVHTSRVTIEGKEVQKGQAIWPVADCPLAHFTEAQKRLAAFYGTDTSISNPSRVLRLPGTLHLKDTVRPQLVTFEVCSNWSGASKTADILVDLPELAIKEPRAGSTATGKPVTEVHLREIVARLDPNAPYGEWRDTVAAIRATPLLEDEDESKRRQIAHEFSRGELDHLERYEDARPSRYAGEGAVDVVFDSMPPKADGVGYGSLYDAAVGAGFDGPPGGHQSVEEVFRDIVAAQPANDGTKANSAVGPISISDLLGRTVAPVQELIPGLIEKGTVTFLSAPGGSHKSRLAVQWGLCLGSAAPVFGRQVARATFVYASYEDHVDEVTRRAQAIASKLQLPQDCAGQYWDLTGKDAPLAIVGEDGTCQPQPFWARLCNHLRSIAGHKFVVFDSTYNALRFAGQAKINETSVMIGIGLLQRLCAETDSSVLMLWHPSQAGQERGDASGWSVAWHNAPRARLSLKPVEGREDAYELKVEKRNHGAKGQPITLYWSDGVLLPRSEVAGVEQENRLVDACIQVAVAAAEQGAPIQGQRRLHGWMIDEIERAAGYRPVDREVKETLARAMRMGRLRYVRGTKYQSAGYYPIDADRATELAREAKHRRKG